MYKVQMQCYEDAKLMKVFPEVVRSLYELDVLAEDTILHWFRKGTNSKGRYALGSITVYYFIMTSFSKVFPSWGNSCCELTTLLSNVFLVCECCRQTFVKSLEPFVNWLEEAEEEE